jgi:hypothetical protein
VPATVEPGSWMARVGWRLAGGPLRVDEHPAGTLRPRNLNPRMLRRAGANGREPGGAARVSRGRPSFRGAPSDPWDATTTRAPG